MLIVARTLRSLVDTDEGIQTFFDSVFSTKDKQTNQLVPDMNLSVYVCKGKTEAMQCLVEHKASWPSNPNKAYAYLDLFVSQSYFSQKQINIVQSQGESDYFSFSRDISHHEMKFPSLEVIYEFANLIYFERVCRQVTFMHSEIASFIRDRIQAGDQDWLGFFQSCKHANKWTKFLKDNP